MRPRTLDINLILLIPHKPAAYLSPHASFHGSPIGTWLRYEWCALGL